MRNLFISICVAFAAVFSLHAQDIIITQDAQKIEAVITKVTSEDVSYKKWSNQDGPTFVLEKSLISSIIYKNGEVEIIQKTQQQQKSDSRPVGTQTSTSVTTQPINSNGDNRLIPLSDTSYRLASTGQTFNSVETVNYLKKNCVSAYNEYLKQEKTSAGLIGTGAGFAAFGVGFGFIAGGIIYGTSTDLTSSILGLTFIGIGGTAVAV